MHFPPPDQPSHHRWIPIVGGAILGLILLLLIIEIRREPIQTEPALPPRVAQLEPTGLLDSTEAADLLVEAVIEVESHGNPTMVGSAGERGLMQIMEGTWYDVTKRHFGTALSFDRAFEPELNRQVGRLYLGDLQAFLYHHQEDWQSDLRSLLFASYNAGPERVRSTGFDMKRLPRVVQSYANRASALHDWYLGEHSEEMRDQLIEAGDR